MFLNRYLNNNTIVSKILIVLLISFFIFGSLSGCESADVSEELPQIEDAEAQIETDPEEPEEPSGQEGSNEISFDDVDFNGGDSSPAQVSGEMRVHFIDVGQGDAVLVQLPGGGNVLIDAGDTNRGPDVVRYLRSAGVTQLDAVVATHPHADHIGGFPAVFDAFEVKRVYMPRVSHTTQTFERFLEAIQASGLQIDTAREGVTLTLDPEVSIKMLSPARSSYGGLNDYSPGIRFVHGNNAFLTTGDAETEGEQEMIRSGHALKANLLKAGHHGSRTSSTPAFLQAVSPSYVVISCGEDNRYSHPHPEVLDRLRSLGIEVFRTDQQGTIVATSDGSRFSFNTTPVTAGGSSPEASTPQEPTVKEPATSEGGAFIGNVNSKIFHKTSCSSLPAPENQAQFASRQEALNAGHRACGRCKP